ncbi:Crp/Fnr family transcriptional regulator [Porphyromonadaceae bacterium W3.11]|nr:Crp/Fnr family transcriptional regulator [Porphyromonadaceae bacterium W3.11]
MKYSENDMELLYFCKTEDLTAEDYQTISEVPRRVVQYDKGDIIARQGETINALYFLTKGKVRTEMASDQGFALYVGEVVAPFPLASAFLFTKNNRFPVDVIANESTEISIFQKKDIEYLLSNCPPFLYGFLGLLGNQMRHLSERLKVFSFETIRSKLAYYILTINHNGEFHFENSITDLASYFGVRRQSLSREISKMVDDKIITFEGGHGNIIDVKKFKELL